MPATPRRSSRSLKAYVRLLGRDLQRSTRRLVTAKRTRGQFAIVFSRPSFKTSSSYGRKWRAAKRAVIPEWRGVFLSLLLLVGGGLGLAFTLLQLSSIQSSPVPLTTTAAAAPKLAEAPRPPSMSPSIPVHLTIPDADVDTDLIQLGTNADGTLETPQSYTVAGWYKNSPTPGEIGPSVITGHVDNYKGPAVFFYLRDLQPGQKISVMRQDGSVAQFAVTKLEQFDQDHFPTEAVYGNTPDAELRLITCGGPFNHMTGEYTQNTVVYATYVPPARS